MAPSLPKSSPVEAASVATLSAALPLTFILTGLAAFMGGVVWLMVDPDLLAAYHYHQNTIAATHLFVLGWICSVIMGAMYQLVPVALETRLYSVSLAWWQFAFHVIGFPGMVWMFHVSNLKQVGHFGSVLAVGVGLFVYNLARTLARAPKPNVVVAGIAAALFWISLTVLAGLSIAAGKCVYESADALAPASPLGVLVRGLRRVGLYLARFDSLSALHAHAHLGVVGGFTMLILGVSFKLVPMFTISRVQSPRRAAAAWLLVNLGLAGTGAAMLTHSPWKMTWALVIVAGLALYGWELVAMLRARQRRPLDGGVKCFLSAVALLGPLAVLAVLLSWPGLPLNAGTGQMENAYGFLGVLGFVTLAIIGMLYKIVPFLVWFGCYSRRIGREPVPALADLYSARWQAVGYWFHLAGLAVTTTAILAASPAGVRCGGVCLVVSAGTLVFNTGLMLTHFFRPGWGAHSAPAATQPQTA